jgi:hypothetical protein
MSRAPQPDGLKEPVSGGSADRELGQKSSFGVLRGLPLKGALFLLSATRRGWLEEEADEAGPSSTALSGLPAAGGGIAL